VNIEFTDDPHPRNTYWEMWGLPMFDLRDAAGVLMELNECRKVYGPLHPPVGVRFQPRLGVGAAVLHRQPARPKSPASGWSARRSGPQHPLHHANPTPPIVPRASATVAVSGHEPALYAMTADAGTAGGNRRIRSRFRQRRDLRREPRSRRSASRRGARSARRELIGLKPVKTRIREIAALLLIDALRAHGPDARRADPAHVVHRQSRHRQDHGGAAHGQHPAPARLSCAKGRWWR
jgi:hypothetical protein